ncbi:MAG: acetyl-CoA carboxylase biotin carboxyl carrier protein subunit [Thermotogae bacterium]|nr:acetyl-CoA carboxylase biotin carboxyl carrier protein subunit [Thermotogota bacterium]
MEVKRYGRWYILNGKRFAVRKVRGGYEVLYEGRHHFVATVPGFSSRGEEERRDEIRAPMAGRVVDVKVRVGDRVSKGEPLVILEAMKMETVLSAPDDAEVVEVKVEPGEVVQEGTLMVKLKFSE